MILVFVSLACVVYQSRSQRHFFYDAAIFLKALEFMSAMFLLDVTSAMRRVRRLSRDRRCEDNHRLHIDSW